MASARGLFPIAKDTLRATLLNSVFGGFTVYNTAVSNLLLAELVKLSGGNPTIDAERLYDASKEIVHDISKSLLDIVNRQRQLTKDEVAELKRYINALQALTE